MYKSISLIILFLIAILPLFSQRHQNNNDFYSYWKRENYKSIRDNSYKKRFYAEPEYFIDSLRVKGVDTIGIYEEVYPGFISTSPCDGSAEVPWVAYVQWEKGGKAYQRKFTQNCRFDAKQIDKAIIIRYYLNARNRIKQEITLPIVTKIFRNKQGKIYSYEWSLHGDVPLFSIYCQINKDCYFRMVDDPWINDSENLFQKQNRESSLNSWINMTKKYVEEND